LNRFLGLAVGIEVVIVGLCMLTLEAWGESLLLEELLIHLALDYHQGGVDERPLEQLALEHADQVFYARVLAAWRNKPINGTEEMSVIGRRTR
jgi:hypothetical protein